MLKSTISNVHRLSIPRHASLSKEKVSIEYDEDWEIEMNAKEFSCNTGVGLMRGDKIVEEARATASGIIRQAEEDAQLERKRVNETIKEQIVDVSTALAEKMLEREINADDHKALIDDFISKIGDE